MEKMKEQSPEDGSRLGRLARTAAGRARGRNWPGESGDPRQSAGVGGRPPFLFAVIGSLEGLQFILDVGDSLTRKFESFLARVILLPFQGMDFDFQFKLPTLKLIYCFWLGLASYTNTESSSEHRKLN